MREVSYESFLQRAGRANQEPTVEILWTESDGLFPGKILLLHDMDKVLKTLDAEKYAQDQGQYYDKTKFEISYMMDGELRTYEGQQDLGDGGGGLLDHLNREQQNEGHDHALHELVPHLKKHVELFAVTEEANQVIADVWATGQEEGPLIAHGTALSEYASACRRELNTAENPQLPPPPQKRDFLLDPEAAAELEQTRRELWHEARCHGMSPRDYLTKGPTPPGEDAAPSHRQGKSGRTVNASQLGTL